MNEPSPGTEPAKTAPERRIRHGLIEDWRDGIGILFLLLVAAFFGALIARFWPESEETANRLPADVDARLGAIEARLGGPNPPHEIEDLDERVTKVETRLQNAEAILTSAGVGGNLAATALGAIPIPGAGPTPGSALNPPNATQKLVDDLATRIAALETKTETVPDDIKAANEAVGDLTANLTDVDANLQSFSERLKKIEDSDLLEMARRASLATAIANLTRAAQGSSPFTAEYDVVAAMSPGDPGLAGIASLATTGVPTAGTLIASFGNAADTALDAERIAQSGGGWSGVWANFMALVSSRPVGEVAGDSTESRIARAELRMKAGDLSAAVKELSAIEGAARDPLRPWLADARARVDLEGQLAELNTRAIKALAGPAADDPSAPVPQLPEP
jgi:hypothetical protein